jgi:probable rRNA maturation factor
MAKPEIELALQVEHAAWKRAWPQASKDIGVLLAAARARAAFPRGLKAGVVAVVLANDKRLQALNFQFRGKNKPTNVLSFPEPDEPFGGLAMAYETIRRESLEQEKSFINHSKHMILHGFLHLLGHDHQKPREARLMEHLEIAILSDLGIPNPYDFEDKSRV